MFGMMFRRPLPPPAPVYRIPLLRVGLVGREHAGKTVLLDQLLAGSGQQTFPSGLHLGIRDPRQVAEALRHRHQAETQLRRKGATTTIDPRDWSLSLLEAGRERAVLQVREAIGQVLTHTEPDASENQQDRYESYLDYLAQADVLWQFVPCPPTRASHQDEQRLRDDLLLTGSYIRAALRRRRNRHPCVLAVVVNRIDARYHSEDDARNRMPGEFLNWLTRQTRHLAGLTGVGDACVIPVTALGFGRTTVRTEETRPPADRDLTCGEREWLLRTDVAPRPYGLNTLLAWSALAGLRQRPIKQLHETAVPKIVRLCQMLAADLDKFAGWHASLKTA